MQPWQLGRRLLCGSGPASHQSRLAPPRPPGALAGRDDRGWRMTAVAVVGPGAMGSRIAARLVAAGHEVTVWNRSAGRAEPLAGLGAFPAATPAEAASRAEVLITMVADPAALRAVTEGPDGVVAGAGASLTVVEMSTVGPAAVARLASVLPPATGLLDAPVMGSPAEAESGSLVIFAGGPAQLLERVLPVLAAVGSVLYVGELGAGCGGEADSQCRPLRHPGHRGSHRIGLPRPQPGALARTAGHATRLRPGTLSTVAERRPLDH